MNTNYLFWLTGLWALGSAEIPDKSRIMPGKNPECKRSGYQQQSKSENSKMKPSKHARLLTGNAEEIYKPKLIPKGKYEEMRTLLPLVYAETDQL